MRASEGLLGEAGAFQLTYPGRLTDLELSGAPGLLTREADQARPTRPLERLVRPQEAHRAQATTRLPERKRGSK